MRCSLPVAVAEKVVATEAAAAKMEVETQEVLEEMVVLEVVQEVEEEMVVLECNDLRRHSGLSTLYKSTLRHRPAPNL